MHETIRVVCGLLQNPDHMRRCAAAIVLAELAPRDAAVVRALGEALSGASGTEAGYILDALEAIGSPGAVPYVLPLLETGDVATKLRAAAIVARGGAGVVPDLRERIAAATGARKLVYVDALARVRAPAAFRAILELLLESDLELVKETCAAVQRHLAGVPPKERAVLHREAVTFMTGPKARGSERVQVSCLILLGHIGRPEARAVLLKHAGPKHPLPVRRHALGGLRGLELAGPAARAVGKELAPYLDDSDETIVRQVLEVLGRLSAAGVEAPWEKLMTSPHPSARAAAARQLASSDTAAANRALLQLLRHEDTQLQEIAAGALSAHPGAARMLAEALADEESAEAAWRLAKILKPHAGTVDPKLMKRLTGLAARDLASGAPRYEALLYFLRNASPAATEDVLREAGLDHRAAGRWTQGVECLRRIVHSERFDDEARYALSVCNLKLSPKDFGPSMRAEDHALRGFHALLRSRAFPLLARLGKDKALDAADLYYVGFHFAEMVGDEHAFGAQLLAHVTKRWPRSPEGRSAKGRLK